MKKNGRELDFHFELNDYTRIHLGKNYQMEFEIEWWKQTKKVRKVWTAVSLLLWVERPSQLVIFMVNLLIFHKMYMNKCTFQKVEDHKQKKAFAFSLFPFFHEEIHWKVPIDKIFLVWLEFSNKTQK